jgi:hypothetical protein
MVRLVTGHDIGRDAAAIADLDPAVLGPGPDGGAVLPVSRRPALGPARPGRRPARVLRVTANHVVKLLAVLGAQVDLIVPAIQAEPACVMLALRNRFLVVVTGKSDGNLLCHLRPPFLCWQIYPATGAPTITTPKQGQSSNQGGAIRAVRPGRAPVPGRRRGTGAAIGQ